MVGVCLLGGRADKGQHTAQDDHQEKDRGPRHDAVTSSIRTNTYKHMNVIIYDLLPSGSEENEVLLSGSILEGILCARHFR